MVRRLGPLVERARADFVLALLALAFGAYVGLVRSDPAGDDEGHRVRRDAVDRIAAHALAGHTAREIALSGLEAWAAAKAVAETEANRAAISTDRAFFMDSLTRLG